MTDAEIDRQAARAEKRQQELEDKGLVAQSARYEPATRRVLIEMSSGLLVGVPVSAIAALRDATQEQLAHVDVDAIGSSLRWEALDSDVSVLGLLHKQLGYDTLLRAAGRAGGRAKSDAKAVAARANGARGGRPRKKPAGR